MGVIFKQVYADVVGTISDPNDKQGSTKRVALLLFLGTVMLLIVAVAWANSFKNLPTIPDSFLNLIYFTVTSLVGGVVLDKGIAAWKTVKGAGDDPGTPP